jgi:hypothetical protein
MNEGLIAWMPDTKVSEQQKVNKWIYDSGINTGKLHMLNFLRGSK